MNNHSFNEEDVKSKSLDEFIAYCSIHHNDLDEVDVIATYNSIVPPVKKEPKVLVEEPATETKPKGKGK